MTHQDLTITIEERFLSQEFQSDKSAELNYVAFGSEDGAAIKNAVKTHAPPDYAGLPMTDISTEQFSETGWYATVQYGNVSGTVFPQPGESVFTFDTGGGTQHITQSKQTVARKGKPGDVDIPDFKGAIAVNSDGVPEGIDIVVPVYNFAETHYLDDTDVDDNLKANLFSRTGKVNNDVFRAFAAGEVLLLGVQGSRRGNNDEWELAFRFAASPNVTGLQLGDITGIDKKGWEFIWVRYQEEKVTIGQTEFRVTTPRYAFVERVYDAIDFAGLGI